MCGINGIIYKNGEVNTKEILQMNEAIEHRGPDDSGRRKPIVQQGFEFELKADMVIKALGFDPENLPKLFDVKDLEITKWGTIKTNFDTFRKYYYDEIRYTYSKV